MAILYFNKQQPHQNILKYIFFYFTESYKIYLSKKEYIHVVFNQGCLIDIFDGLSHSS